MIRKGFPLLSFLVLCGLFVFYVMHSIAQMPQKVATHFGGDGRPNGWMTREALQNSTLCTGLGVALLIVLMFWFIRLLPSRFFNLPNRDYWLAPERRIETLDWMQQQGFWMGSMMLIFMGLIHASIIKSNAVSPPHLDNTTMFLATSATLAGSLYFVVRLVLRFSTVPKN